MYKHKGGKQGPEMKDFCCQTSDYDDSDNYELSAMEKDIYYSTGCLPKRFDKILNNKKEGAASVKTPKKANMHGRKENV
jgi:hypothetical protein